MVDETRNVSASLKEYLLIQLEEQIWQSQVFNE